VIECVFVSRGRGAPEERIFVCLRGDAPTDLDDAPTAEDIRPFDPRTCRRSPRLSATHRKRWPEQRLRREVAEFLDGRERWPTYGEFQASGRGLLYHHVRLHGGWARWARAFAFPWDHYPRSSRRWTR
jgi:hypothetical protein